MDSEMRQRKPPADASQLDDQSSATTRSPWSSWNYPNHPLLPTPLEARLLVIYPLTLFFGAFFSTLTPYQLSQNGRDASSEAIYSPTHQSFQPQSAAPSYFALKKNVFNVYFVKKGWGWTSVALLLFVLTHHFFKPTPSSADSKSKSSSTREKQETSSGPWFITLPVVQRRRLTAAARYLAVTAQWFLVTQWFFGPAIIDRGFLMTGGACRRLLGTAVGEDGAPLPGTINHALTSAACKFEGGTWSGGIDISGHVVLLILASGMLWMEILPVVLRLGGLREQRLVRLGDGTVRSAGLKTLIAEQGIRESDSNGSAGNDGVFEAMTSGSQSAGVGVKFAVGVCALMWWMLLMTAAYFHTWSEKLSGLVVAFLSLWLVYFLPRGVPFLRSILGMPGF